MDTIPGNDGSLFQVGWLLNELWKRLPGQTDFVKSEQRADFDLHSRSHGDPGMTQPTGVKRNHRGTRGRRTVFFRRIRVLDGRERRCSISFHQDRPLGVMHQIKNEPLILDGVRFARFPFIQVHVDVFDLFSTRMSGKSVGPACNPFQKVHAEDVNCHIARPEQ